MILFPRFNWSLAAMTAMMMMQVSAMTAAQSSSLTSSIERAVTLHNRIFSGYALVLVLTAIFTWLVWRSGNAVQDAVRAEADARIAQIKSDGEAAKRESEKEIAGLKTQGEGLKAAAEQAKSDAATANERAGKLELETAKQQERAAVAEKSLLELQRRIAPRRFSPEVRTKLAAALTAANPKGVIAINCVLGDGEGFALATQVDEILRAAGWPTTGVSQGAYGAGGNPIGFMVVVGPAPNSPPRALALQKAFEAAGVAMAGRLDPSMADTEVKILVGNKPQ